MTMTLSILTTVSETLKLGCLLTVARIQYSLRKVLEERLHDRWRKGKPVRRLLDSSQEWEHRVKFIKCDDSVIVVSRADHTARVYSTTD